jgi:serine/threonine-protein kinase
MSASDNEATPKKKTVTQLGDFKLVKKLGQGGMGTVYLAKQVSLDRKVALKTLSKEFAKKDAFVKRFIREARSMAKLQHPNIVQVYAADSQAGFHYAAIEFIDGKSMQDWMDELKQLSVGDALHVTLVCADALAHAHEQGMIHRDIKPDNILVTQKGIVKVADFGLAKVMDEDVSVTQSGTGLGTPLYMAPEQARNAKHIDQRSDIYALGCTLYYLLTGQLPFLGENTLELIMAKEEGKFKSAKRLNSEIPEQLDLMIDKMIARKPEHRYSDCQEIIRDLQKLGRENATLSFLGSEAVSGLSRPGSGTGSGVSSQPNIPNTSQPSSVRETSRSKLSQTQPVTPSKDWFVRYTDVKGKFHMSKMTTQQVITGIREGKLSLESKAKTSSQGELLPLAQYSEFTKFVEKRAIKTRVAAKESKMKGIYQEVEDHARRKKRWAWLKRLKDSTMGGVGLVVWLALIAGVAIGTFYLVPMLWDYLASYFNLK